LRKTHHESINKLHGLGTSTTNLSRHNDFATLSSRLHDETNNTIASSSDSKTAQKLVTKRLSLRNSRKTTVGNLLSVKLDGVVREVESFLNDRGQFTDTTTLLAENVLGLCCTDDYFSAGWGHADFDSGVTFFGELLCEEGVELGKENTVSDKLFVIGKQEIRF
jgi:hypothetical protein